MLNSTQNRIFEYKKGQPYRLFNKWVDLVALLCIQVKTL